jgi:hypothetical protein
MNDFKGNLFEKERGYTGVRKGNRMLVLGTTSEFVKLFGALLELRHREA